MAINNVGDAEPYPLTCSFTFPPSHGEILVESAGNEGGCDEHRPTSVVIKAGHDELEKLAVVLNALEVQARQLDPRVLAECRFFGPWGADFPMEHYGTTV
ncbi:hypothetical protein ACFXGA_26950 [Actinosynnema sp. NPDC059335]|uniref:hypothetical protein n=1 Tax=Actinosynnema sp. NPDC059335 TaxID=3346804 RepID=UPI003672C71D